MEKGSELMEDKSAGMTLRPRILLVHESRIMRASVTRYLKQAFECIEAHDIESGWQMLQDDASIAVVLADIGLPREEGVGFLARVRGSVIARVAQTPVIMIASEDGHPSNAVEEARARASLAGALDFISKSSTATEIVSRIRTAYELSTLRRSLEEAQRAAALNLPVDPRSGLMTIEYLEVASQQAFSAAQRIGIDLALIAIGIDGLAAIDDRHNAALAPVISRELSPVMARLLRREDTLAALGVGRFMALVSGVEATELALRIREFQSRIASVVMRYAGEVVQVSLCVGAASLMSDTPRDVQHLAELAQSRLGEAQALGEGRYIGPKPLEKPLVEAPLVSASAEQDERSIDAALLLLREKRSEEIRPRLHDLTTQLVPLLRMIEREYQLNFRLSRLKERALGSKGKEGA
jgi:diguanylate cyclase (GGDEF)-like protein